MAGTNIQFPITAVLRILITGCAGFLGGSIAAFAAQQGHIIIGTRRTARGDAAPFSRIEQVDLLQTDIANLVEDVQPDLIVHAAGGASVRSSFENPLDDLKTSVMSLTTVLESVRRSNTNPLIVFPSSAAVYGNPRKFPVSEDSACRPISPYGYSKLACEMIAQSYAQSFGLRVAICRLFSVVGPRQKRLLLWDLFTRMVSCPEHVALDGTGSESRDYLHVDDVASAILAIAQTEVRSGLGTFSVHNVASGQETTVSSVAGLVRDLISPATVISYNGRLRVGDPARWVADVRLLHALAPTRTPRPFSVAAMQCMNEWQHTRESEASPVITASDVHTGVSRAAGDGSA